MSLAGDLQKEVFASVAERLSEGVRAKRSNSQEARVIRGGFESAHVGFWSGLMFLPGRSWWEQVPELLRRLTSFFKIARLIVGLPVVLLSGLHRCLAAANKVLPDLAERCRQIERMWRGAIDGTHELWLAITRKPPERRKGLDRRQTSSDSLVHPCRRVHRRRVKERLTAA